MAQLIDEGQRIDVSASELRSRVNSSLKANLEAKLISDALSSASSQPIEMFSRFGFSRSGGGGGGGAVTPTRKEAVKRALEAMDDSGYSLFAEGLTRLKTQRR